MYRNTNNRKPVGQPHEPQLSHHVDLAKMVLATSLILGTSTPDPVPRRPTQFAKPKHSKERSFPKKRHFVPFCNLCGSEKHYGTKCKVPLSFKKRQIKVANDKLCPLCYAKKCMKSPDQKCKNRKENPSCQQDECEERDDIHTLLLCPVFERKRQHNEFRDTQRMQVQKDIKDKRVAKMVEEREKQAREATEILTQTMPKVAETERATTSEQKEKVADEKSIDEEIEELGKSAPQNDSEVAPVPME